MKRDKKNKNEIIKFVLIDSPGKIFVDVKADKQKVISSVEFGIKFFAE